MDFPTQTAHVSRDDLPQALVSMAARSEEMDWAIRSAIGELDIPPGARTGLAQALYAIAFEHGAGLRTLLQARNPVPALALLRPQAEALARATWGRYTASETWIRDFFKGRAQGDQSPIIQFHKDPGRLVRELENHAPPHVAAALQTFLERDLLNTFHAFTHGGRPMVDGIVIGHQHEVLQEALIIANSLTLFATAELLSLCRCVDQRVLKRIRLIPVVYQDCFEKFAAGWMPGPSWNIPPSFYQDKVRSYKLTAGDKESGLEWELRSPWTSINRASSS